MQKNDLILVADTVYRVPDTEYTPDVLLTCENYESEEK